MNVSNDKLLNCYFSLTKLKLSRGYYVYKEGDESEYVYILKKGELEIMKKYSVCK